MGGQADVTVLTNVIKDIHSCRNYQHREKILQSAMGDIFVARNLHGLSVRGQLSVINQGTPNI